MFSKTEMHMLIDALMLNFSDLEKQIRQSTDKVYSERRRKEQDALLTLLLKTINLSDTAQ